MGPIKSGVGASWKLFETRVVVTGAPRSLHPTPVYFFHPPVWAQSLSRVRVFATSWTGTLQVPLSMEFSRQEYWNGLSFPPPGESPQLRD